MLHGFFHFFLQCLVSLVIVWHILKVVTNTNTPICVVKTKSMWPEFSPGDVILITNFSNQRLVKGDIVVFKLPSLEHPVVHRIKSAKIGSRFKVISLDNSNNSSSTRYGHHNNINILTKGDRNWSDDSALYAQNGRSSLGRENILGKVRLRIPFFGHLRNIVYSSLVT